MIAGADILVDAEARLHHALAVVDRLRRNGLFAALLVEHAFRRGDDDLRPLLRGGQRLLQRVAHLADIIGAVDLAHPVDADAAHRFSIGCLVAATLVVGARGEDVLAAGRRRIEIVDDDDDAVAAC